MRRACFGLLAFVVQACVVLLASPPQEPVSPALAITHGPYLQLATATSVTVVWHTNRASVSRVEYGEVEPLGLTAMSSRHGLIDNDRTSHAVSLTGLKPGTTYRYRVVSRAFDGYEKQHIVRYGAAVAAEISTFTTLDPGKTSYSFTLVTDIHENAARMDALLAPLDWDDTPFVVFDGDMVNDFMAPDQPFAGFVDAAVARFARAKPFVYVRGNHDVRGRYARRLEDYFPTAGGRAYYSFDHGPVHFVVLDSGEDKEDSHEYYNGLVAFESYRREQARWLAEDLRSPTARQAKFRVVFSHIPPYGGSSPSIEQVRSLWEPIANQGGVDLWLCGHVHKYLRFDPVQGKNRYQLLLGTPDTAIHVHVTPGELKVNVSDSAGRVVDALTVAAR